MVKYAEIEIKNIDDLRKRLLSLSEDFEYFSILDSQGGQEDKYKKYKIIAGFGALKIFRPQAGGDRFEQLREFRKENADQWLFGYLSYELKNDIERLHSSNPDRVNADEIFFFVPEYLVLLREQVLQFYANENANKQNVESFLTKLEDSSASFREAGGGVIPEIKHRISRREYLRAVENIRDHIKKGDVYELNYCQEFYAEKAILHPPTIYQKLSSKSPTPFSAFLRNADIFVMSASPERYLQKSGNKIISQPIKGTARRSKSKSEDNISREKLRTDPKERAENIMIVDLVRNDLSHTAAKNSVVVEELCAIYSFPQVHQMISTVSSTLDDKYDFIDLLRTSFPMGSMTGAPKIRAMQLIEQYEKTKRGIYSGAIGYIDPQENFDFNVVIRTLIYNAGCNYLSFITGGAITYKASAKKEYEESLLKAEAIREILES